jgi:hypothetical protein
LLLFIISFKYSICYSIVAVFLLVKAVLLFIILNKDIKDAFNLKQLLVLRSVRI